MVPLSRSACRSPHVKTAHLVFPFRNTILLGSVTHSYLFFRLVPLQLPADLLFPYNRPSTTRDQPPTAANEPSSDQGATSQFVAEVWADNWFALYVNGELVGEDSTPITTERSFNAETIVFTATYPLTIGIEAKDFKETNSGLEYIGERNQQMGDGGIIAQITDLGTGKIVAVTNWSWQLMVIHRAPLNPECENSPDPNSACRFESTEAPPGWTGAEFDAGAWSPATEWTEAAVRPRDGYNTIQWDESARLIWGSDLEVDNTVLLRLTVPAPS